MSKREIPIRFTSKQKELVNKLLGRSADQVIIPKSIGIQPLYGISSPVRDKTKLIPLTDEQKKLLRNELNATCDYLELAKELIFK